VKRLSDGGVGYTVSEVVAATTCQFAALRDLDRLLGWLREPRSERSAMEARAGRLGEEVEGGYLAELRASHGAVRDLDGESDLDSSGLRELLESSTTPLFQVPVRDGRMRGRLDFLVPTDDGWELQDSKVARSAKPSAAIQLALYWDVLDRAAPGRMAPQVAVLLGTGERATVRIDGIVRLARRHRRSLERLLDSHQAGGTPVDWQNDAIARCGSCSECSQAVEQCDDVLGVAGLTRSQRIKLREHGIRTVSDLAVAERPAGLSMAAATWHTIREQARLQRLQTEADTSGQANPQEPRVFYETINPRDARADFRHDEAELDPCLSRHLQVLPQASPGDIYFDFEGDPLWHGPIADEWGLEYLFGCVLPAPTGACLPNGLQATADVTTAEPVAMVGELAASHNCTFTHFWAEDWDEERRALVAFLDLVQQRRDRYPDMHIYHYAAYEVTALKRLVRQHSYGEELLDDLLQAGVFVDLYPVVRNSVRVSQPSYSIKKLEALYMGGMPRSSDLDNAEDSIILFDDYLVARAPDRTTTAGPGPDELKRRILTYNEYDCVSTLRLHQWLVKVARENSVPWVWGPTDVGDRPHPFPVGAGEDSGPGRPGSDPLDQSSDSNGKPFPMARALAANLNALLAYTPRAEWNESHWVCARMAGVLAYYQREEKSLWWDVYFKLENDVSEWPRDRLTFRASGPGEVLTNWSIPGRARTLQRRIRIPIESPDGNTVTAGDKLALFYERADYSPTLPIEFLSERSGRVAHTRAELESVADDHIVVVERLPQATGGTTWSAADGPRGFPIGAMEFTKFGRDDHQARLNDLAVETLGILGIEPDLDPTVSPRHLEERFRNVEVPLVKWPARVAFDLLAQREPRTLGAGLPQDDDLVSAITTATLESDDSIVAVQGPPGTGKSYTGAHVMAALAARSGWGIGVTAQSHKVIEGLLDKVVPRDPQGGDAPLLPPEWVGKKQNRTAKEAATAGEQGPGWTWIRGARTPPAGWSCPLAASVPEFVGANRANGFVVGSTSWGFVGKNFAPQELDLLVIDEAAQFSLADALACAGAARRMLLLGDPQQLRQVNTVDHPFRAGDAVLEYYANRDGDSRVLDASRGYFLPRTWRMHPEITQVISHYAYDDALHSHRQVTETRWVESINPGIHLVAVEHDHNTSCSSEEADRIVTLLVDLTRHDWVENGARRRLTPRDVMVVAAYNAQVHEVQRALTRAGLSGVKVGTVDRFQGGEAPIAVLTLAASTLTDAPRGAGFLLQRNRVNVALSRAKYAAYVVASPKLFDSVPTTL